jgi:mono/diheme cytochrome c family protein
MVDCLLPRAAALDAGRDEMLVACLGRDEVVAYDARAYGPTLRERRRWKVPAGPTGIAVDPAGERAIVWSQWDGAFSILPLAGASSGIERVAVSAPGALDPRLDRGRRLFHEANTGRISKDGKACASCHIDARDDGLTWLLREGPRQTPMLLGRLEGTAPYGWLGKDATLHEHLRGTFGRLHGTGLSREEVDALLDWVGSLRAPEEPARPAVDARMARGKVLFHSAETACSSCHGGERSSDGLRHDVRTGSQHDAKQFDTPSLRFVARSAPYLHDGSYATIGELLSGMDGKMGFSKHLSDDDRGALAAYVESL